MRFLIFGRGRIAEEKYVPLLRETLEARPGGRRLETVFVDVGRSDSLEARDWDRVMGSSLAEIDKILILSPPAAHLENMRSVVRAYAAAGVGIPPIYIEKPIYLSGERPAWRRLLAASSALRHKAFYVDHYRFKAPIACLVREKAQILERLGPLEEIGWVSLEAQPFWDSRAFAEGYFLEHACHFVAMMGQVFPEAAGVAAGDRFVPRRLGEWRAWVQQGRPESCGADSAALLYLQAVAPGMAVTVITGKGMADKKFVYMRGDRGYCSVWFNEGRMVLSTADGEEERRVPTVDSYLAVVSDILAENGQSRHLLSLEDGMAEQEAVIDIRGHLPVDEVRTGRYEVGDIPPEIRAELQRMGA